MISPSQYANLSPQWTEAWGIDYGEFVKLQAAMEHFGEGSGQIVQKVIHGAGADLISENITKLLPVSGRKWAKKATAASKAMPKNFVHEYFDLAVQIVGRGRYGYLYFPDDGSNTVRHAGNQQFMRRGAEASTDRILNMCVDELIKNFNGGT